MRKRVVSHDRRVSIDEINDFLFRGMWGTLPFAASAAPAHHGSRH